MAGAIAKLLLKKVSPKTNIASTCECFEPNKGDSSGGYIEIEVINPPKNLGEPVFDKLEANLAKGILSIGATKSFETDLGIKEAGMSGKANNKLKKGTLGGISTGNTITLRITIKPTPSVGIKGRHDVCIVPRVAPVVEAMVAIVLADHYLRNRCSTL